MTLSICRKDKTSVSNGWKAGVLQTEAYLSSEFPLNLEL
jgi:hypothetical protein